MPPKRKAAAIASDAIAPRRTLRDTFKSVSKASTTLSSKNILAKNAGNAVKDVAPTVSTNTSTAPAAAESKKRKLDPVIVQDGDEDVILVPKKQQAVEKAVEKEVAEETPVSRARRTKTETQKATATTTKGAKGRKKAATTVNTASKTRTVKNFFAPKAATTTTSTTEVAETTTATVVQADASADTEDNDDPESLAHVPRFHRALITALLLHYSTSNVAPLVSALTSSIASMAQRTLPESTLLRIVHLSPYLRVESPPLRIHLTRPSPSLETQTAEFATALAAYTTLSSIPSAKTEAAEDLAAPLRQRGKLLAATLKGTPKKATSTTAGSGGVQRTLQQSGMKVSSRASSLLERIKEKQARANTAPTQAEQATMLAEARVPEVVEVLKAMRRKGESRALKEVVEDVRGSVKRPIAPSEAEEAVRILAKRESWVDVKEVGGVQAVVFRKEAAVNRFI